MIYNYNKLVRNKIMQNIQAKAHNEEIADIIKAIETIIKQRGMSLEEIQKIKEYKK